MKAYEEDPLIYHGRVMFSWVGAMRDGIESIQHQLSVIQLPVLFIHGKEDQTVPIGNSHFGFEQIGSEDRTFKVSSSTTYNYTTACIVMFGRATHTLYHKSGFCMYNTVLTGCLALIVIKRPFLVRRWFLCRFYNWFV